MHSFISVVGMPPELNVPSSRMIRGELTKRLKRLIPKVQIAYRQYTDTENSIFRESLSKNRSPVLVIGFWIQATETESLKGQIKQIFTDLTPESDVEILFAS